MYYKITNTASEVYQKLHAMRTQERQWEIDNRKAIESKVGNTWKRFRGYEGQQTFNRVTHYSGFEFETTDNICPKTWKQDKDWPGVYVPNLRTKAGKEMSKFLNDLPGHWYGIMYDNLGMKMPKGRNTFPFVEISGETIILFLDNNLTPPSEDLVEITKKEFEELFDNI